MRAIFMSAGGPKSTRFSQNHFKNGYKLLLLSAVHIIDSLSEKAMYSYQEFDKSIIFFGQLCILDATY